MVFPLSPRETFAGYVHAGRMPNKCRAVIAGLRMSEMPLSLQQFLEGYIPKFIPKGRIVRVWSDVHDLEEGRI